MLNKKEQLAEAQTYSFICLGMFFDDHYTHIRICPAELRQFATQANEITMGPFYNSYQAVQRVVNHIKVVKLPEPELYYEPVSRAVPICFWILSWSGYTGCIILQAIYPHMKNKLKQEQVQKYFAFYSYSAGLVKARPIS